MEHKEPLQEQTEPQQEQNYYWWHKNSLFYVGHWQMFYLYYRKAQARSEQPSQMLCNHL